MPKEDKYALNVMERCVTFENGHYVMPLMWRPDVPELPCNRNMVLNRLASLKTTVATRSRLATVLRGNSAKLHREWLCSGGTC